MFYLWLSKLLESQLKAMFFVTGYSHQVRGQWCVLHIILDLVIGPIAG